MPYVNLLGELQAYSFLFAFHSK